MSKIPPPLNSKEHTYFQMVCKTTMWTGIVLRGQTSPQSIMFEEGKVYNIIGENWSKTYLIEMNGRSHRLYWAKGENNEWRFMSSAEFKIMFGDPINNRNIKLTQLLGEDEQQ